MGCLMTKSVSLSDDVYATLKSLKKEGESFSDVVIRITDSKPKRDIMDFWGKWSGGKEELDRMEKEIYAARKRFKLRTVDFDKGTVK